MGKSKVIKCSDYSWNNIPRKVYKDTKQPYKAVCRYSLLGESEDEKELNFHTRYFEVQPGGYTSLEYHRHPHSVIVIRGRGTVILENEAREIGLHDVVYVAPSALHQFHADRVEPLGFICVVDRYRDRPALPDDQEVDGRLKAEDVRHKIRR